MGKALLVCLLLAGADPALPQGTPEWLQDAAADGLKAGAKPPAFELPDQTGHRRSTSSLMGRNGLVVVFFRSADW